MSRSHTEQRGFPPSPDSRCPCGISPPYRHSYWSDDAPVSGECHGATHLEDAAAATILALERGERGIYNVVDDEPAPVREWLPALAAAIGAKPPRRVPRGLARLLAGESGVVLMTEIRGASNAKAKRELGWTLRYPSWRQGFRAAYGRGRSKRVARSLRFGSRPVR